MNDIPLYIAGNATLKMVKNVFLDFLPGMIELSSLANMSPTVISVCTERDIDHTYKSGPVTSSHSIESANVSLLTAYQLMVPPRR